MSFCLYKRELIFFTTILLISLSLTGGNNICIKKLYSPQNLNQTEEDLIIAIYVQTKSPYERLYTTLSTQLEKVYRENNDITKESYYNKDVKFNIKTLMYYFDKTCNVNFTDLFVDILLNESLNNGKLFQIIGILTYIENEEIMMNL